MSFPSNPTDGQTAIEFGRTFVYKSSSSTWMPVSSPSTPTVRESIPAPVVVANATDLPMVGNTIGRTGYVSGTNRLYIWNGSGWFEIALVNTNPTITDSGLATYELNRDGTPTVITLVANDPEGVPLTWSYAVSSGALEDTTITNEGAVFTITPGETAAIFELTFTASDGINIDTSASSFTLAFIPDWSTATLVYTLDNPNAYNTSDGDRFGYAVAISGNYAIVGAWLEDDASGTESGKAYIYNATTGTLLHTLDNPNPYNTSAGDNFGWLVAIDGNYAIVSAPYERDAGGSGSGKAYIYNVTTGVLVHTLNNPNPYGTSAYDLFGQSVSISGNYAIVGAAYEDESGVSNTGKAYIYNVTTGVLVHTLNNPNPNGPTGESSFGYSVAISGNYAIVGAPYERDAGGTQSGKAYIFDVTTGSLVYTMNNPNAYSTSTNDKFAYSVGISGNYAIVGAFGEDPVGTDSGIAYVYNTTNGFWTDTSLAHTLLNPAASNYDEFGIVVRINGDYAIVSSPSESAAGLVSGSVYIYDVTTGTLLKTINDPNAYSTSNYDRFGSSAGIYGKYAIVGAWSEDDSGDNDSGKAYIFKAG